MMSWNAASVWRVLLIWGLGGFLANVAWEMLQMPLYKDFEGGWGSCLAAALGDVAILAGLYVFMACAAESWLWFRSLGYRRQIALAAAGFLVAVVIELRALAEGSWIYAAAMPLVPFFGVGWVPILQMIVIPLGLAWLSHSWVRK
jgi:hypothetical protein